MPLQHARSFHVTQLSVSKTVVSGDTVISSLTQAVEFYFNFRVMSVRSYRKITYFDGTAAANLTSMVKSTTMQ